jgi:hypothetical protein
MDVIILETLTTSTELQDERLFAKKVLKIYRTMIKLEEQKYLEPVQSTVIEGLA